MDYEAFLGRGEDELEDDERTTFAIADLTVRLIARGGIPGQEGKRDPDAVIDGILLGLALVMEQAPEHPNSAALRRGVKAFGTRLHDHAKMARAMFERNGEHPIGCVLDGYGTAKPTVN